jgi:hypothetical protein
MLELQLQASTHGNMRRIDASANKLADIYIQVNGLQSSVMGKYGSVVSNYGNPLKPGCRSPFKNSMIT